jgi:branched-chain amino acid transport system ATP-binding protein
MNAPLLEVRNITKRFGGLIAINKLSFDIHQGEIVGLIGPNGAGKTTLFNVITGFYPPTEGKAFYKGEDITGFKPHKLVQKGIARSFQLTTLFSNLSVFQNVVMSQHLHIEVGFLGSLFHTPGNCEKEKATEARTMELLKLTGLDSQRNVLAKNLSHGYQKILNFTISIGTNPELLMLDEPLCALNPERIAAIQRLILTVRDKGVAILVIEHNMKALFPLCDRIIVLDAGMKIAEGTPKEVGGNPEVIRAYLGGAIDVSDRR